MTLFRQPPVWSPLTFRALLAGVRAAWLSDGAIARRALEQLLRAAYSPTALYLSDSGTSALTVALQAAHAATGAPVALPAYCCYDVATAADGAGVPFFLYDIDPATLSPDLASLRRALEAGAGSVVVAHLYGVPAALGAVRLLTSEFGAILVEDAAQGSGCLFQGRPAGAHGALGVLSFGRGKGVTGGKGGALLVNDERLATAVSEAWGARTGAREPRGTLTDYIVVKAQWLFGRPALYWIPAALPFLGLGETTYRAPRPVADLSNLAAGILVQIIPQIPEEVRIRRENAARIIGGLAKVGAIVPPSDWEPGWLRFPIVLQRTAAEVMSAYHASAGILQGYPKALPDLAGFGERRLNADEGFSGARLLAERLVTLPTHRFVRGAKIPAF